MTYMTQYNTAIVQHRVVEYGIGTHVVVEILDGYDDAHAIVIDRPAAARALIVAAQAYLDAQKVE